jgi:ribosome-associated protein
VTDPPGAGRAAAPVSNQHANASLPTAERRVRRAARAALEKRALDLVVLDVQRVSGIADYFLICSGRSTTHITTIMDAIREELKADGVRPRHAEGQPESGWVLLDYGDVLIHLFLEDTRAYYALERLWGDVPLLSVEG